MTQPRPGAVFSAPLITPYPANIPSSSLPRLKAGFTPRDMDDRWVVEYTTTNESHASLNFYRSWTGYKCFELRLRLPAGQGEWAVVVESLVWEGDADKARLGGAEDAKENVRGLVRGLLGVEIGEGGAGAAREGGGAAKVNGRSKGR